MLCNEFFYNILIYATCSSYTVKLVFSGGKRDMGVHARARSGHEISRNFVVDCGAVYGNGFFGALTDAARNSVVQ